MRNSSEAVGRKALPCDDAYPCGMATADSRRERSTPPSTGAAIAEASGESADAGRLLLIEDEPGIVDFVSRGLEAEGFVVEAAMDGIEGERMALGGSFDAIVLDLMLPRRGGLEVLGSVRRSMPNVPVIVLTARGEIEDRVAGLDAGAVDYLVKPFSVAELVRPRARAAARGTRRRREHAARRGLEVDLMTRKVTGRRPVTLSTTEFELLVYLLRHRGPGALARADPQLGVGL